MRLSAVLLGMVLVPCVVSAENWPEWRGPRRDGTSLERNLPVKWSATENVKWKTELPGPGNSTPIVWGNQVFITQAVEDEGKRLLISFDRRNGKKLWEKGTVFAEKEVSHETNPQCSSSPATDGERVIAWFGSAGVFCYDLQGKELWKRDLGKHEHEWGYAASPVIHGDLVFLNFGPGEQSFLVALNKKTGEEVWRYDIEEKHYKERKDGFAGQDKGVVGTWSTPILVKAEGREDLVMTVSDKMIGLDPKTGKEIWFCRGLNPLIYTSPVFSEGLIVGTGGFHGPDMAVRPGGKGDVTETHKVWEGGRTQNRLGSPVINDGYIFLPTMPGMAECIELKTGKKVWEERIRGTGAKNDTWSSMVLAGDNIYVVNQSGNTIVLKANPKFEIVQVNSIGNEMCNSSIAVSDGDIFIRTHENLWCVSGTTTTAGTAGK
jgi:outer membrane protein assembly factor BamB